jgi:hypothetical protein
MTVKNRLNAVGQPAKSQNILTVYHKHFASPLSFEDRWKFRRSNVAGPNCGHARQKKRRRKLLPVHLSVDLVWQFFNAESLKTPRQYLVGHFPALHFIHEHLFGSGFPAGPASLWDQDRRGFNRCVHIQARSLGESAIIHESVVYDRNADIWQSTFLYLTPKFIGV